MIVSEILIRVFISLKMRKENETLLLIKRAGSRFCYQKFFAFGLNFWTEPVISLVAASEEERAQTNLQKLGL